MMYDTAFRDYIDTQIEEEGVTVKSYHIDTARSEDIDNNDFFVNKSKVVYVFENDDNAFEDDGTCDLANKWFSKLHDEAKANGYDFAGSVKFKKGKQNKEGEVTRPGCYEVTIQIKWC